MTQPQSDASNSYKERNISHRGNRRPHSYKTENHSSNSGIVKQIICCELFILVTRKVSFNDSLLRETKGFEALDGPSLCFRDI
jgi:hypothetical protein